MTGNGTTVSTFGPGMATVPNMGQQIADYLGSVPYSDRRPAFYDLGRSQRRAEWRPDQPDRPSCRTSKERHHDPGDGRRGAKEFLVGEPLPSLNLTPAGAALSPAEQAGLAQFSDYFNMGLKAEAAKSRQRPGREDQHLRCQLTFQQRDRESCQLRFHQRHRSRVPIESRWQWLSLLGHYPPDDTGLRPACPATWPPRAFRPSSFAVLFEAALMGAGELDHSIGVRIPRSVPAIRAAPIEHERAQRLFHASQMPATLRFGFDQPDRTSIVVR